MARIFITYRHDDGDVMARRLERDLVDLFQRDNVLNDQLRLAPGMDIRGELARRITHSNVMIVVIGRFWLSSHLQQATDPVRLSVELGLKATGLIVIPVLVEGAVLPTLEELPPKINALAYRTPMNLRDKPDYQSDLERLANHIRDSVAEQGEVAPTPAKLQTIPKAPTGLTDAVSESKVERVIVVENQTANSNPLLLPLIWAGKLFGNFLNFIASIFATIIRQMVSSIVAFVMWLVLLVSVLVIGGIFLISMFNNNFDLSLAIANMGDIFQEIISMLSSN